MQIANHLQVLLAEDDPKLLAALTQELRAQGFVVHAAADGLQASELIAHQSFDLAILDIGLPHKSGFELCTQLRQNSSVVPIMMLTALSAIDDKLEAFRTGADDYMVKPFHTRELMARVEVLLKRANRNLQTHDVLKIADLTLDLEAKTVTRAGKAIDLTAKEFSLLVALLQAGGRVLSKQQLSEKVWGLNFDTGTNTVEVYISFLRGKIDKNFPTKLVHTKAGFGYYLAEKE